MDDKRIAYIVVSKDRNQYSVIGINTQHTKKHLGYSGDNITKQETLHSWKVQLV